jgi:signal transduction histidine kinase
MHTTFTRWSSPIVAAHHSHHVQLRIGVTLVDRPNVVAEVVGNSKDMLKILALQVDRLALGRVEAGERDGALEGVSDLAAVPDGAELCVQLPVEDLVGACNETYCVCFNLR